MKNNKYFLCLVAFLLTQITFAQKTETRDLPSFSKIAVTGAASITLEQGGSESAKITATNVDLADVKTVVRGNTLHVDLEGKKSYHNMNLKIHIKVKNLEAIELGGAVNVKSSNTLKVDNFHLESHGAGDISLKVDAKKVNIELSGAGNVNISGKTNYQNIEVNGAGNIKAYDLISNVTHAELNGAGNLYVHANRELNAELNGVGNIKYKGSPSVNIEKNGMGSLIMFDRFFQFEKPFLNLNPHSLKEKI